MKGGVEVGIWKEGKSFKSFSGTKNAKGNKERLKEDRGWISKDHTSHDKEFGLDSGGSRDPSTGRL